MKSNVVFLEKKINILKEKYLVYQSNNSVNNNELYECLCDILSWFEICIKNIDEIYDSKERGKISAIKYANNMKKHSSSIFEYTLKEYALLPSDNLYPSDNLLPSDFNIVWNILPLDDSKYKNQFKNYKKYLRGRNILETVEDIYSIIKTYL